MRLRRARAAPTQPLPVFPASASLSPSRIPHDSFHIPPRLLPSSRIHRLPLSFVTYTLLAVQRFSCFAESAWVSFAPCFLLTGVRLWNFGGSPSGAQLRLPSVQSRRPEVGSSVSGDMGRDPSMVMSILGSCSSRRCECCFSPSSTQQLPHPSGDLPAPSLLEFNRGSLLNHWWASPVRRSWPFHSAHAFI